jgi:hypothetical protein
VRPPGGSGDFLGKFREVWTVVASWGRWCDEEIGEWPTEAECLAALPGPFVDALRRSRAVDIVGWLDDLHDRDWILWSCSARDGSVKIDLDANSMPLSAGPVRLVVEVLGGQVLYSDLWQAEE